MLRRVNARRRQTATDNYTTDAVIKRRELTVVLQPFGNQSSLCVGVF